jgi:Ubiquitin elongating factor core
LSSACRYLANGGTFTYSEDEERLAASPSDYKSWVERIQAPAAADGSSPFHFVCECFFMTAAVLHVGVRQLIASMQNARQEYELVLQQGPLARQDIVRAFFSFVLLFITMLFNHRIVQQAACHRFLAELAYCGTFPHYERADMRM